MQYLIVENKQSVLLGPMDWRPRFFQSELDDLEIDFQISPSEPMQYMKITDEVEIYPVAAINGPADFDPIYQHLAGPFWIFENNVAVGTYTSADNSIEIIQANLKNIVAAERYKKEVAGTTIIVQGNQVFVATDRDSRNVFVQKLITMADSDTVQWKFADTWLELTKADLTSVVSSINSYVQAQYDWEKGIIDSINAAFTITELKSISYSE